MRSSLRPADERELLREVLAKLDALAAQVAELRAAADRARPRQRDLSMLDRRALERLLPVVAAQFAGNSFQVWELLDAASMQGVAAADMQIALGEMGAHRVGKLLRRATDAGAVIAGLRVEAVGRGKWRLIAD